MSPGLSSAQAAARLAADGPNVPPPPRRKSELRRFVDELTHFFALLLWSAAVLAFLGRMPQLGVAISAVVLLNAVFSFWQERRADRAADRLAALLPDRVTVVRDGRRQQLSSRDVVVGDLLALAPGDRIAADAQVVVAAALRLDTSLLTGETTLTPAEAGGRLFAGTFVVEGEAHATVVATGARTRLAQIAALTSLTPKPTTPLAAELRRVVRIIAAVAVGMGALFFAVMVGLHHSAAEGFVFAIGVTVALVPEALLPTVTLTLAWGAEQMVKRNVLVRELEAVETLGSTTVICTDKTGTLTKNEMTVLRAWTPAGQARCGVAGYDPRADVSFDPGAQAALADLAAAAVRCSDGYVHEVGGEWLAHGDPMEAALDVFARRLTVGNGSLRPRPAELAERFPFDPRRRRMSVVSAGAVLVKGAPDTVLPLCPDERVRAAAHNAVNELAAEGLRVLAVGRRLLPAGSRPATAAQAETDLELLGLLGLEDPPRGDVHEALDACRQAGIAVVVVTGDHPATAASIATQVGLRHGDEPVLVGADLPSDDQELGALIDRTGTVVARVSPEDKLRIARVLRERGHVVAMTGDGVNDVPALHTANIGIAMGRSGSDVAREAADLVLLDDHFASIVAGVELGRATFANIRRFLTYHLTDNVAELAPFLLWALTGGRFPLALGVMQILALDIGTDTASAVALGAEPPARHLLQGPPVVGKLLNATVLRRAFGVLGPTEALWSLAAFTATFYAAGWRPGAPFPDSGIALSASGAAFLAVVFAQAANAFACRSSTRWPGSLGWLTNRLLPAATGAGVLFALAAVFVPTLARALGQAPPVPVGWAFIALGGVALLGVDAIDKVVRRRQISSGRRRAREGEPDR